MVSIIWILLQTIGCFAYRSDALDIGTSRLLPTSEITPIQQKAVHKIQAKLKTAQQESSS